MHSAAQESAVSEPAGDNVATDGPSAQQVEAAKAALKQAVQYIIKFKDNVVLDGDTRTYVANAEKSNEKTYYVAREDEDVKFTAKMEDDLDDVESGEQDWVDTMERFYGGFAKTLEKAEKALDGERIQVPEAESDVTCDLCGRKMVIKSGRFGKFLACPGYPDCKSTKPIIETTKGICPKCGGAIVAKKSKNNRKFFGCANYPKCDFVTWSEPVADVCPTCGKTMFRKKGKNGGVFCATEGCKGKEA